MSSELSQTPHLTVVTGLSGSGISTAIHALEDLGYFCVDNRPPPLVPKLMELARDSQQGQRLAVGLDARGVKNARAVVAMLDDLRAAGSRVDILFLDSQEAVLLRRFSESRRRHPMAGKGVSLLDAVRAEREAMHPFRDAAQSLVDTSDLNVHECKRRVQAFAEGSPEDRALAVSVLSFGFRHGLPPDADIVWDVRFLPNPHFIPELHALTGLDEPVRAFVLEKPETQAFLLHFLPLLDLVLPQYQVEGKRYLTVALGCTAGKHRSVALAETTCEHLRRLGLSPNVRHRDIEKVNK